MAICLILSSYCSAKSLWTPPTIQLRTNTLYYCVASPNIGFEIQTDTGLAWQFDYIGAWWNSYERSRFLANYAFQTEMRYYLDSPSAKMPYFGHHAGVYGQLATYDFKFGTKGIQCAYLHKSFGVGASYGYSMTLTRKLALDFTAGIGYFHTLYNTYSENADNSGYAKERTRSLNYFGPTKLEVSLVWTINNHNPVPDKSKEQIIYY